MKFDELVGAIHREKTRQIEKHNLPRWHDLDQGVDWLAVLSEEFGEVAEAVMAERFGNAIKGTHMTQERIKRILQAELVDLITVAAAWACDEE